MNYLVVTVKSWNIDNFKKLQAEDPINQWFLITDKNELTLERVKEINPRYIFFPHWSWIIPKEIFTDFECIVFHMTDLPYGRGGSPLQNLIARGHTSTKISAIRVDAGLDTGPIYKKEPLDLHGSATEIFERASKIIFPLIKEIAATEPMPVPQIGEVVEFKRRKPEEGDIAQLRTLEEVYNYIRMLDAEDYPHAFFETEQFRFEFEQANFNGKSISAHITILKK